LFGRNTLQLHEYRPDIDGLRAISVALVIAFHAFPDVARGGFIGVDIFFVISGYLISNIIFSQLQASTFSFTSFFLNRVRRIFPALLLVLCISIGVGAFILQPDEQRSLLNHAASSGIFILNYVLANEGGYFDRSAEAKPLLNLWSLSVEEQFYVIWPIILLSLTRFKWLSWVPIALLGSISLAWAVITSETNPVRAFYHLETRVWELSIGSGLAYIHSFFPKLLPQSTHTKNWLSGLSLFLIVITALLVDKTSEFLVLWMLIPTLSAALLIACSSNGFVNAKFLSRRTLVSIGLISYPLYLWHWPIFSLARIHFGGALTTPMTLVLIGLSLFLATITYRFLERPIRRSSLTNRQIALRLLVPLILLSGASGYLSKFSIEVDPNTLAEKEQFYSYFARTPESRWLTMFEGNFRHECNFYQIDQYYSGRPTNFPRLNISPVCYEIESAKSHRLLLWGDSHAQMLYFGLSKTLPNDWQVLQITSSGCAARIDNLRNDQTDYCARSNKFAIDVMREVKPDVVVIAQSADHNVESMNRVTSALHKIGIRRIIFVGPSPRWEDDLPKILIRRLWPDLPERTWVGVKREAMDLNSRIKGALPTLPGRSYIDVIGVFCDHNGCLTRIGEDSQKGATSWDYGHLTEVASEYLAKKLLVPEILKYSSP
jgi:peptidoglycan/LPS O-acetylase OafA/YrhL